MQLCVRDNDVWTFWFKYIEFCFGLNTFIIPCRGLFPSEFLSNRLQTLAQWSLGFGKVCCEFSQSYIMFFRIYPGFSGSLCRWMSARCCKCRESPMNESWLVNIARNLKFQFKMAPISRLNFITMITAWYCCSWCYLMPLCFYLCFRWARVLDQGRAFPKKTVSGDKKHLSSYVSFFFFFFLPSLFFLK